MTYTHRHQHSISIPGGTYLYERALPKPCIHPLITPNGTVLTGFEPSDHVWHRGLWFTIKLINGANFWEEHAPFGVQESQEPVCAFDKTGALTVSHTLFWTSESTSLALIETRSLTFDVPPSAISDSQSQTQRLTWRSTLTAQQDLTLDRTPFTTWGGYGGLSFRASRELHEVAFQTPDGTAHTALTGQRHDHLTLTAKADGGPDRTVSIACFDHPSNTRSPVPWYAKSSNGFTFFNAAFLFHEPMLLAKGKSLSFAYGLAYRDGAFVEGEVANLARDFRNAPFPHGVTADS